ncbi:hypothetical protein GJ496_010907 [Pomphorhynchus laevis]|nr:hypothetical protein GJ496_010907 [Pomphorhynchus laevis]
MMLYKVFIISLSFIATQCSRYESAVYFLKIHKQIIKSKIVETLKVNLHSGKCSFYFNECINSAELNEDPQPEIHLSTNSRHTEVMVSKALNSMDLKIYKLRVDCSSDKCKNILNYNAIPAAVTPVEVFYLILIQERDFDNEFKNNDLNLRVLSSNEVFLNLLNRTTLYMGTMFRMNIRDTPC